MVPYGASADPIRMGGALLIRFDTDNRATAFSVISRQAEAIPYDVHVSSFDAKYQGWRVILDEWLAKHEQRSSPSGVRRE